MLNINKYYVYDESKNPIAVQIPITEFKQIENIIKNYALSKLMDETNKEELLNHQLALKYYETLKNEMGS